jgi:membrane protein DedA with SNARE-associated domain
MTDALQDYGVLLLFAIVALQAMGIPGLPGKSSLVAAGILAADGWFDIWSVVAASAVAGAVGGYAGYTVGRLGGRPLVERLPFYDRLEKPLTTAERFLADYGPPAVFFARFLPGLKVVAAPTAGLLRMPVALFAVWHTLAAIGFALLFGLTAFYLGKGAISLVEQLGLWALVPLAALAALGLLVYRVYRRRVSEFA